MTRVVALTVVVLFMMLSLVGFSSTIIFPEARATMSFGFLLLAAYLVGDALSSVKLPKITGYILAGVLFGPHVLELVAAGTVRDLKLIDDLALSFIALAAGGELRLKELRTRRKSIALTLIFLTLIVFVGVGTFVVIARPLMPFLAGKPMIQVLAVAAIVATFAVARSPSSAVAIISECKARGPFTEMVLGVTVVMDVLVIMIFAMVVSASQTLIAPGGEMDFRLVTTMGVEIVGAIVAGVLLGLLIGLYIRYVQEELLVFILGVAFMTTFFSHSFAVILDRFYGISFHLEPMLICITAGFLVQNASPNGNVFMEKIDRSSLPIYVIFFALTGAALNVGALRSTWLVAIMLVGLRAALIWLGAFLASRLSHDPPLFGRWSGLGFVTQAGVSLGLAGIVMRRFPDWGPPVATMIVAIIAVNQIIGPVAFKMALNAVGEARKPKLE